MSDSTVAASKKPIYRTRNLVLAAVALLVGWLVFEVTFALTATPGTGQAARERFVELLAEAAPDDQNDADPYALGLISDIDQILRQADEDLDAEADALAERLPEFQDEFGGDPMTAFRLAESGSEPFELGRRQLDRAVELGLDDRLDELAATRNLRWQPEIPGDGPLFNILLPELGVGRSIARVEVRRAALAAERGDWRAFEDHVSRTAAIAEVTSRQPFLISRLVAIAIEALLYSRCRQLLLERELPTPAIDAIAATLDRFEHTPGMRQSFRGEKVAILDVIDRTHTGEPGGGGRFLPAEFSQHAGAMMGGNTVPKIANVTGIVFPGRATTEREIDEFYDTIDAIMALEPAETLAVLDGATPADQYGLRDPDDIVGESRSRILQTFLPAVGHAVRTEIEAQRRRAGVRTLIAVEGFIAARGRPPASAAELTGFAGPDALHDPMSGERFAYASGGEIAADPVGRPFIIYVPGEVTLEDLFEYYAKPIEDESANLGGRAPEDVDVTAPADWNR